jgi:TolA-binding protein
MSKATSQTRTPKRHQHGHRKIPGQSSFSGTKHQGLNGHLDPRPLPLCHTLHASSTISRRSWFQSKVSLPQRAGLIPKLVRSRDGWKAKATHRKHQIKDLRIRIRDLTASRLRHRERADRFAQENERLQLRLEHIQQQCERLQQQAAAASSHATTPAPVAAASLDAATPPPVADAAQKKTPN